MTTISGTDGHWKRVQRVLDAQEALRLHASYRSYSDQQEIDEAEREYAAALKDLDRWITKLIGENARLKLAVSMSDMADAVED